MVEVKFYDNVADEFLKFAVISLGRVTRKRMHEYYKNFVSDPDIFMDMSKYFEYQYSPERIDKYWETRKKPKDRKDFFCSARIRSNR